MDFKTIWKQGHRSTIVKLKAIVIDGDAESTGGTVKVTTNNGNKWITLEFREINNNVSVQNTCHLGLDG